jgi:hypothetical protein
VSAELTKHFGDQVFRTIVPRNVRLAEAPSHGQSIVGYDKASRGGIAYLGLAGEVLRRQRERDQARRRTRPRRRRGMSTAKKRGLGRGLEALLGPKAAAEAPPLEATPATRCARCRSIAARRASTSRAARWTRQARRAGRVDQGAGRDPADRRARPGRPQLRDHRRRTPLARVADWPA